MKKSNVCSNLCPFFDVRKNAKVSFIKAIISWSEWSGPCAFYCELLNIFSNLCIFRDAEIMRQKQEKKAEAAQGEVKK